MPKAVVFHEGDLAPFLFECSTIFGDSLPQNLAELAAVVRRRGEGGRRYFPACPQMHSTGFFVTMWTMLTGGCVVTISGRTLDAPGIWHAAARDRATNIAIVGDSFARPLVAALDAAPAPYNLETLEIIGSSGAMWSAEIKERLVRRLPHVQLLDVMSSTESIGLAASVTTRESCAATGGFALGANAIVIDEDNRPMRPGSGVPGRVAVGGGMQPFGYYKDPEKTRKTFPVIDGVRYSVPGDYAILEADGTIRLLGRGSSCINTGGEKVFPEEVEEALKTHPAVQDALVIGLPDPVWGQAVTGVITLAPAASCDPGVLRAHVKGRLAGYKVPKSIVIADVSLRGPNGKADYKAAAACAARHVNF
jgi:fatty-acyl-CoA synthase